MFFFDSIIHWNWEIFFQNAAKNDFIFEFLNLFVRVLSDAG